MLEDILNHCVATSCSASCAQLKTSNELSSRKWERAKMAAPPVVPVADLGDGQAAVNSVSF